MESAQNLVQQLRDLGYAPTVNAPEGRKVTVLVGPYENPDALTRTEARLATNGLDSFRVR
ncbi:SPOR domain-containing protein [Deinococcus caeni]|uniref:SPOR domain-containing protein n=1 Tax=Deinococcus caeni TaxID=569127 RepID=UPI00361997E3